MTLPSPIGWGRVAGGRGEGCGGIGGRPAGSNTTGSAAEKLGRRWLAFEKDRTYLAASAFRFVDELPPKELATLWSRLSSDDLPVAVNRQQRDLVLMDNGRMYGKRRKTH